MKKPQREDFFQESAFRAAQAGYEADQAGQAAHKSFILAVITLIICGIIMTIFITLRFVK